MDKIRESEIEYTMFLDSWQDITAPSGNEIHLNGYIEGCKSRDEEIKNLLKIKKVNEKSMAWTVKYNYNLIAIVEEIIDLVDVDYLEPDFRQRAKNVLLGRGLASIYRDEEIKKLRDALEWIIDEAQRQREGEGGDLRTIKHFAEQALKDGE